jgi:hypothetical protein
MDALSPIRNDPLAYHEAGYRVAAKHVGIPLMPFKGRQDTLRCYFYDVVADDGSTAFCERAALIMLIGGAALAHFAPAESAHDDVQARELLYHRMWRQAGEGPFPRSMWNEFHILIAQLQDEASAFVAGNQGEIARTAAHLAVRR